MGMAPPVVRMQTKHFGYCFATNKKALAVIARAFVINLLTILFRFLLRVHKVIEYFAHLLGFQLLGYNHLVLIE